MLADKFNDHLALLMSVTQTFDDHLAPLLPVEMNLMTIWPCLCWLTNSMTIWPCFLSVTQTFDDHYLAPLLPVEMNLMTIWPCLPHRLAPAIWRISYILQNTYVGTQIVRMSSDSCLYCIWLNLFWLSCNQLFSY